PGRCCSDMREHLAAHGHRALLVLIVVAAFLARTVFLWRAVFTGEGVNYQDSDAWYHMRLIENLTHHYPHRATIDPYLGSPAPPDLRCCSDMREHLAAHGHRALLVLIVVAAFLARTVFLWRAVFTGEGVNYQDSDAWYHMRLIENLTHHYPHRATIDPYLGSPAP